jgi:hypothetical protein
MVSLIPRGACLRLFYEARQVNFWLQRRAQRDAPGRFVDVVNGTQVIPLSSNRQQSITQRA